MTAQNKKKIDRIIKFRAWGEKKMMYADSLDRNLMVITPTGTLCYLVPPTRATYRELVFTDYILMQYTGLTDKNGKEIYEGDIVNVTEHFYGDGGNEGTVYEVRYMDSMDYPAFELAGWQGESNGLSECLAGSDFEIEVIGNIYENPELLGKESI